MSPKLSAHYFLDDYSRLNLKIVSGRITFYEVKDISKLKLTLRNMSQSAIEIRTFSCHQPLVDLGQKA